MLSYYGNFLQKNDIANHKRLNVIMQDPKVNIYQIYYLAEQTARLDPAFIPYDNINPPYSAADSNKFREWPILRTHGLERAKADGADIWGFVSYKWDEKTRIPGQKFVDFIKANPDNDVWFMEPHYKPFNPFINSWIQGNMFHPGISRIANSFMTLNNIPVDVQKIIMPMCYYNFFAGTQKFWDTFFLYIDQMIAIANNNPNLYKLMFETGAGHGNDNTVPYFIFLVERMFPTAITLSGLKHIGLKYHTDDFLVEPKNLIDVVNKIYTINQS